MSRKVDIALRFLTGNAAILDSDQVVLSRDTLVCVLDCSMRWILALKERKVVFRIRLFIHERWVSYSEEFKFIEKIGSIIFTDKRVGVKRAGRHSSSVWSSAIIM